MLNAPLFSIVIPTHNRVAMLRCALASVAAQTVQDYEVIVVDDGSSDDTAAFLGTNTSAKHRFLRNEASRGVAASRNRGVEEARGEFIVFLDDDDELRPNALSAIRAVHAANGDLDFMWGARLIHTKDSLGEDIATRQDDWSHSKNPVVAAELLQYVLVIATSSAFAIRRQLFRRLGGFDERLRVSEDRDLFIRLAEQGCRGAVIPQVLIDVNEHFKNSLSRNVGVELGPKIDLQVLAKHKDYLSRPEHAAFINDYLRVIFAGFLRAGNRMPALHILGMLMRRHALTKSIVRMYLRNAPEIRVLKSLLQYDLIRSWKAKHASADAQISNHHGR